MNINDEEKEVTAALESVILNLHERISRTEDEREKEFYRVKIKLIDMMTRVFIEARDRMGSPGIMIYWAACADINTMLVGAAFKDEVLKSRVSQLLDLQRTATMKQIEEIIDTRKKNPGLKPG